MLGYGYGSYVATQAIATLRERSIAPQRWREQPNLPDNDFLGLTEQYWHRRLFDRGSQLFEYATNTDETCISREILESFWFAVEDNPVVGNNSIVQLIDIYT